MKRAMILGMVVLLLFSLASCSWFDRETTILVYLEENLTDAEARAVATKISALQGTISVEFVTAEQAFADFVGKLEDPSIMEGLDVDILCDRCEVITMESDSQQLAREIKKLEGVADVSIVESSQVKNLILDAIS